MWILAGSLVELVILSAVLVLYPLQRSRRRGGPRGGHAGPFLYFASLGLGFILVEVALLQKLSVFLGGPAYALSITLSALLLSSGLGSFASQGWARRPAVLLSRVMPALALVVGAEAFLLDTVIQHLLGLSLPGRALAAVALIAPMGFLMGIPFPAGLRLLEESRPELKPWAWGINACATVVGSTACMCLVSSAGFRAAILAGSATYLVGWAALEASRRSAASLAAPAEGPE